MSAAPPHPLRGELYADGQHIVLVVSRDSRNDHFPNVLVAEVTESLLTGGLNSVVPLDDNDPVEGSVHCDFLFVIEKQDLGEYMGTVSQGSIDRVDRALLVALGI